jgi:hypothetical protein
MATRQRPTKVDEIDLFSGLLFCADCGCKMYAMRGGKTSERKDAYTCGNYRNRTRSLRTCTTHYIRKIVIEELVLGDLKRVLAYVKSNEDEFVKKATEYGDMEAKKALRLKRREYDKGAVRRFELDTVFKKLYEDNALGKLSDQQFVSLTSGYEEEREALTARMKELERDINSVAERNTNVDRFVKIVEQYSDIKELNYETVHEFIDRILIHEPDMEAATRKVEIHYSFVGQIDSGEEATATTSILRREHNKEVKSYVI